MFHLNDATKETVRDVLVRNADRKSTLYTDESRLYTETGAEYATHRTVKHSAKEYARREGDSWCTPIRSKTFSACSTAA